jgi:phosphoglycolate phosphatase
MIGDTTFDMAMARAAGVRPIGVGWGYHPATELTRSGASAVAVDYPDLLRLLNR